MRSEGVNSIVTGGGKGIGRAITLALAREGSNVAVIALRDRRSAEQTADEVRQLGRRAIALLADITQPESVDSMVGEVVKAFGRIDLLVNNAGMSIRRPLEELPVEEWDRVVAVNLRGVFLCSVAVLREMRKHNKGSIINIAGASAHRCHALAGAFGPSKAGVVNLTRQMAVEWARYNIRVNTVSPGPTMTADTEERLKDEDIRRRIDKIPLSRVARPEEVANVVAFLASEDSSYMTGQSLIVDGGSVHTWYLYP